MGKRLTPDDKRIWAKVAGTVTPRPGRKPPSEDEPDQKVAKRKAIEPLKSKAPAMEASPVAKAKRSATPPRPSERSGERRIRRGRVEIAGRLDLHGMTQDQARAALASFLARLAKNEGGCALVITGKGRIGGEGILRRRLPEWLAEPELAALSSGYAPAHIRHGGEGAWYVFVKKPR